jgi:hypothetical protein
MARGTMVTTARGTTGTTGTAAIRAAMDTVRLVRKT